MPDEPETTEHQDDDFDVEAMLLDVRRNDPRYSLDAYRFLLFEGLEFTMREHLGMKQGEYRHMNGREIVEGLRRLALREFGYLARDVWNWWGIKTTRDWGEVTFGLINAGLLNKQDDDAPEDFDNVYDVSEALNPRKAIAE